MVRARALDAFARMYGRLGVSEHYAARALRELEEHLDDLVDEAKAAGLEGAMAEADALARLGTPQALADATEAQVCFDRWTSAPLMPLGAGCEPVLRWGVSAGLGAAVTSALLFGMHTAILLPL
ncbi:MAG: hypothetical protein AAGD86_07510 [Pseudomonadota bacterium]